MTVLLHVWVQVPKRPDSRLDPIAPTDAGTKLASGILPTLHPEVEIGNVEEGQVASHGSLKP